MNDLMKIQTEVTGQTEGKGQLLGKSQRFRTGAGAEPRAALSLSSALSPKFGLQQRIYRVARFRFDARPRSGGRRLTAPLHLMGPRQAAGW